MPEADDLVHELKLSFTPEGYRFAEVISGPYRASFLLGARITWLELCENDGHIQIEVTANPGNGDATTVIVPFGYQNPDSRAVAEKIYNELREAWIASM